MHGERFHLCPRAARTAARILLLAVCAGPASPALALESSAGLLTEHVAIESALARPAIREAEDARLLAADSLVAESQIRPNPVVSLSHENARVPEGSARESTVMVSQAFELSGRRALRQAAAETRREATQLDSQSRRLALVQEVRRLFADALYQQHLRAVHAIWLQRLEAGVTVVGHLAAAGEASGYDRRRLEREAQSARAKIRAIDAEAARKRALLAGVVNWPVASLPRLDGELLPDAPPAVETLLDAAGRHPEIAQLETQAAAFERDREAALRLGRPDVTVGLGTKHVSEPGFSDNGLVLELSVPIPLFDRGQVQAQQARAQSASLQAERSLRLSRMQAELRGTWSQTTQLREAALAFRDQTLAVSQELSGIAEASYRAGEGSLLELLDAYRAELDAQTLKLDLALQARMSRIELDALTGATSHE